MRHYKAKPEDEDLRIDHYLSRQKPDLTRSFIQKLIKNGNVFINQKKITKTGHKLRNDDEITLNIPSIKEVGILAEKIPLKVIYEDEDIIVVNKSPGMVVHPTDHGAHVSGTLVNALMHHCKDLSGIGGEKRPGIVHRLDKNTSGLIISAKNDKAHHHISEQIQARKISKKYLALLNGHLKPEHGSVEAPLIKSQAGGKRDMQVSGKAKAKYALTHYEVLDYVGQYSLVSIQIITGRTHQIRVHFKSIGHTVCGDEMYGDSKSNSTLKKHGLKRQFLHAAELTFRLPKNNESITLKAPLPNDLKAVLEKISNKKDALI